MRTSASFATFLLCGIATAQFGADTLLGSMSGMTCSNGESTLPPSSHNNLLGSCSRNSWKPVVVKRQAHSGADSDLVNVSLEAPEDGVLVISDSHGRCEHFEVYIDDQLIGETSGTGALDFSACGLPDECMEKNGGQHGYFALPKGNYKLGLKWTKVTPQCDRSSIGEGHYKFHRKC
ncbi:hypothetical protein COCMIDRAFT_27965 [Bipolaris oryzae ATCC 44560]|uniref:Uncharacterized protein n=1 Tax=Bipolaris oryzae ATCC 44560 TaxID=930090 RepID=W6YVX3_COCMI|nr:uncharacterized protein COCMIDRAFT_27965 [Bipolaris oryzae ATCC 44560]EUC43567.1 hypothetical protein COCMIDRAFT_27965 [Bipolaris oryzae ATCC 44560]